MRRIKSFLTDVAGSCIPLAYPSLCKKPLKSTAGYFFALLLVLHIIAAVLLLPKLAALPGYLEQKTESFDSLTFSSNVSMAAPILIPEANPQLIIDTTGAHTALSKGQKLLITKDAVHINLFRAWSVPIAAFEDFKANSRTVSLAATGLLLLMLPGIIVWSYVILAIKYLAMMVLLSLIVFTLLDLTRWKKPYCLILKACIYAATPMAAIEMLLMPFNATNWLIPVFNLFVNFYLVTMLLYLALTSIALLVLQIKKKETVPSAHPV